MEELGCESIELPIFLGITVIDFDSIMNFTFVCIISVRFATHKRNNDDRKLHSYVLANSRRYFQINQSQNDGNYALILNSYSNSSIQPLVPRPDSVQLTYVIKKENV